MPYSRKPEMILFDVGGTLFDDGKCIPVDGLSALRQAATNPHVTDDETLASLWDEFMNKLPENTGIEFPLSAPIKYVTMKTGLKFDISVIEQEEIFDRFNSTRTVIHSVPELFEILREKGIRTAIISNNAMSGESLTLAIDRWIPTAKPEFCLTSADILFPKPDTEIFLAAADYAGVEACRCWYCGDSFVPDVKGSKSSGMTPVLLDTKNNIPAVFRTDDEAGEYLTVNNWDALIELIRKF